MTLREQLGGMTVVAPRGAKKTKAKAAKPSTRAWHFGLVALGVLALWQIVSWLKWFPSFAFPSPASTWQSAWQVWTHGYLGSTLLQDLIISFERVGVSYLLAVFIGITLGIAMTQVRPIAIVVDPILQFLRPIPPLAYIPLFVVWFGIGETPKILLIMVSTLPVIVISTVAGIEGVPKHRIEIAKNLGAKRIQILTKVKLPSALPDIFTGLKVAIGVAWSTLVAAELIAASKGLGWLISEAGQELQTGIVVTGIIAIGLMGYGMDLIVRLVERLVIPWKRFQ